MFKGWALLAGGNLIDVCAVIAKKWVDLAVNITQNYNPRRYGVKLVHLHIIDSTDHKANAGTKLSKIDQALYIQVFDAMPA